MRIFHKLDCDEVNGCDRSAVSGVIELPSKILFSDWGGWRSWRASGVGSHDKMMTDNNENLSRTFIRFDHLF